MRALLQRPGWPGDLLALAAGGLLTLAFAPFGWWPLGLVAMALYGLLIHDLGPSRGAWRSYLFGAGLFVSGSSWVYVSIHDYGQAPVALAGLLTLVFCLGLALFFALLGLIHGRWLRGRPGGAVAGLALVWVLLDWLRSWLLTGFPWLYPGYAFIDTPLAGWAPVGGIWLVSLTALWTGLSLGQWLQRRPGWRAVLAVAGLWLGGGLLGQVNWTEAEGEPLRVALVQANISQSVKWDPAEFQPTLERYQSMSSELWHSHDLVVWPEAAIPGYFQAVEEFVDALQAEGEGAALLTGTPWLDERGEFGTGGRSAYNSVVVVDRRDPGRERPVYHKQHLVPFGEYVPLEQWLRGLIAFFDLPMSSFSAGSHPQPGLEAADHLLAPAICYEVVYPEQLRQFLPAARVLVTLSNDAWFGRSIGPHQHLQMARMRALEYGREMIRATGNGITALVDHRGDLRHQLPQFEQAVLSGTVQPRRGWTPFAATGTAFWVGGMALALGGLLRRGLTRHNSISQSS